MKGSDSGGSEQLFEEIKQVAKYTGPTIPSNSPPQDSVPNYTLHEEIHRGAQGVVFKATQESTKRTVAIKFILHGSFATPRQRFRFEREIDLASRLNHPHIVTVFDGGIENNRPYCVMEFIDGQPLDQFHFLDIDAKKRTRLRSEIFCKICSAVGYAHSRGIIHRDLKPANILVDHDHQPHVLDFGLAKINETEPIINHSPRTMTGEFVGTLSYASPEQVKAEPDLVDVRSDVYSLGVIFYEWLTGQLPYRVDGSIVETLENIASKEPNRPTGHAIDLELETILLKCLSKTPSRRYQNAMLLADDLQRYLDGDPIDARRDSTWYLLSKSIRRHKNAAIAAFSFLALLVASLIAISIFYMQAIEDRNLATTAKNNEIHLRELETEQRELAEFRTYMARIAAADASVRSFSTYDVMRNLYRTPPHHQCWEYWYVYGQSNLSKTTLGFADRQRYGHQNQVQSVDYHPNQNWLVSADFDGTVIIWDTQKESILCTYQLENRIKSVRFHPSGELIAVGFFDENVQLLRVQQQASAELEIVRSKHQFSTHGLKVFDLDFSPDGRHLMIGAGVHNQAGELLIFDWESEELVLKIPNPLNPVRSVAWSHDGSLIAFADNQIYLWDFQAKQLVQQLSGHENWINCIDFRPDGKHLVSCANEPTAKIWGVQSGRHLKSLFGHTSFVNFAEYSSDSLLIATGSKDTTLRIWNARNAAPISIQWGQYSAIAEVSFCNDNRNVASCGTWCVKTWDSSKNKNQGFANYDHRRIQDIKVCPDSKTLLTCDDRGCVNEYDLETQSLIKKICRKPDSPSAVRSIDVSSDGNHVVWANNNHNLYVLDRVSNIQKTWKGHQAAVTSVCIAPNDKHVFSSSEDGTVRRWNLTDNSSTVFYRGELPIKKVLQSSCGNWIAVSNEGQILIVDANTKQVVTSFDRARQFASDGYDMAFAPSGDRLVAPAEKNTVNVWSIPSGELLGTLVEHSKPVQSVAFTPDGRRVATSSREGTIKLWDLQYFQVVITLQEFNGFAEAIEFSPDGSRLVSGLYDGSIKLWETLPESQRPREHRP